MRSLNRPKIKSGDIIHLYSLENNREADFGTGEVVYGPGKSIFIQFDHGCKFSGKQKLSEILEEFPSIEYCIITSRNRPVLNTQEELEYITKEDLSNLNYLLSRGFTGSIKRTIKNLQLTIMITQL